MTESWLEELSRQECLDFLAENAVGRIGIVHDGRPSVFPINYRLVEFEDRPCLVMRTRPGNVIDNADTDVAFEIDGIDLYHQRGWSVLVHGVLRQVEADRELLAVHFDSDTWIAEGRTTWLILEPEVITGRRLVQPALQWAFRQSGYL